MLRLHPTVVMLTGDDISLAMDHLNTSKAITAETSLSSLTSTHPEQHRTPEGNPSRIHKELRSVLAHEDDYDRIQKLSGFNIRNDGMDGAFEHSLSYSHDTGGHRGEELETLSNSRSHIEYPMAIYPLSGGSEWRSQTSEGRDLSRVPNLDGIPLLFSEDQYGSPGTEAEYQFEEDTTNSTPMLSVSGSIVSGPSSPRQGMHSPERPIGIILRGGASTDDMSSEYYVTSTCPEFVGPAEAFSLRPMYDPHNTTTANGETDTISSIGVTDSRRSSPIPSPEASSNFCRRGLGTYDNSSNLEHARSVFSPFTYSPEEPELGIGVIAATARDIIPSPQSSGWELDNTCEERMSYGTCVDRGCDRVCGLSAH